jgi:prepilin-type N-terminal cleavage/methylation domain-containing protein
VLKPPSRSAETYDKALRPDATDYRGGRVRNRWWTRRDDDGFTLLEVIVAMTLLGLILAGSATLFIASLKNSTGMDRRQVAVTLAGQQMETVRAIRPETSSSTGNPLVEGRKLADVTSTWPSAPADFRAVTLMTGGSDSTPVGASPTIPFSTTSTVDGQSFKISTWIGTCTRATTTNAPCDTVTPAAGAQTMYRVVVVVSWNQGAGSSCSGTGCSYTLSTLIDPSSNYTFNTVTGVGP